MVNSILYKKRKPFLAFLLSIISVGLGQLYNGRLKKSGIFVLLFYLVGATLSIALLDWFQGMVVLLCLVFIALLYMAIDAFRDARSQSDYQLKSYNRWYVYIAYAVLLSIYVQEVLSRTVKSCCYEAFKIPSASMNPTIIPGDHLIVKKLWLSAEKVRRGDVVVFTLPSDPDVNILKRVVGLPGETVEVKDDSVFINSERLVEPYAQWESVGVSGSGNFLGQKIPDDSIFVLGDNRDHSKDSRYFDPPFVPLSRVTGKARYVYWSWEEDGSRPGKRLEQ